MRAGYGARMPSQPPARLAGTRRVHSLVDLPARLGEAPTCELRTLYQFTRGAASAVPRTGCQTGMDSRRIRSTSAAISSLIRYCRVTVPCPARVAMSPRVVCPMDALAR